MGGDATPLICIRFRYHFHLQHNGVSTLAGTVGGTARRQRLTVAQRRERHDALVAKLADAVAALATGEGWLRYLRAVSTLREYSPSNQMLILQQRPDATRVAGYRAWQSLGRQVRSGSKAIWIFGYATRTSQSTEPADTDNTEPAVQDGTRARVYFPLVKVFDISDTEGSDIDFPDTAHTAKGETSEVATKAVDDVTDWLTAIGWTIVREPLTDGVRGYTAHTQRRIALAVDADLPETARVLLHEACHSVLHAAGSPYINPDQYAASRRHRGVAEVQADGAAFVLADHLGLDTLHAATGYVAGWASAAAGSTDPQAIADVIRTAAAAVHHAVCTITDGLAAIRPTRPAIAS